MSTLREGSPWWPQLSQSSPEKRHFTSPIRTSSATFNSQKILLHTGFFFIEESRENEWEGVKAMFYFVPKNEERTSHSLLCLFFYQTLIFCFPTLLLQSCWAKYNIIKMDAALPFSKFKKIVVVYVSTRSKSKFY